MMEACEVSEINNEQIIDLPDCPICVGVGEEQLQDADIDVYSIDGTKKHGILKCINANNNFINFLDTSSNLVTCINFEDCRYIKFCCELIYVGKEGIVVDFPSSIKTHTEKQPFIINFKDGESLTGDTINSTIDSTGIHLFSVVDENYVQRLFMPCTMVSNYEIGDQIGTILKSLNTITDEKLEQGIAAQESIRKKPLGEYLTDSGIVDEKDLHRILEKQKQDFQFPKIRLGELLISEELITREELDEALGVQAENRERRLGDILIDIGATSERAVHVALARKLGVPFVKLKSFNINIETLDHISVDIARKEKVMPLMMQDNRLVVAIPDPARADIRQILGFLTSQQIEVVVSTPSDIEWAINHYYGDNFDLHIHEIEAENSIKEASNVNLNSDPEKLASERPIVRLVHNLLLESIKRQASDIHIRPTSTNVQVLFRIHGKLVLIKSLSKSLLNAVTSRIKVIAHMDIAQRRLPQDGRVQLTTSNNKVDMRVSSMPTVEGESIVIRILANAASLKPVEELGFNDNDTNDLLDLLNRSSGILLVTGPTGSGKSTTLYSALNILKQMNLNIITVEDPVEIRLDGIEQIQVATEIDLDFGKALRNILRHDPDVIMIGEIRDEETANIAFKAAQTGHLVLSTLHTNSAADTIVRLRELNVEPYLIASCLLGVVAQRLITKNCDNCKNIETISYPIRHALGVGAEEKFYYGEGCESCSDTGVSGRLPAYEFLRVTESFQQKIVANASTLELKQTAEDWGMQSIIDCGLKYAKKGQTPIAEVHRILAG